MMSQQRIGRRFSLGIQIEHRDVEHKPRMLAQAKEPGRKAKRTLVAESPMRDPKNGQNAHRTLRIPPKAGRDEAILGEEGLGNIDGAISLDNY